MTSYHSPLTKSPIPSPYPSPPIHKHHGKPSPQVQDTDKALRRIAAPSAPSTAHTPASPAHPPAPPRTPSHPPGHAPSHVAITATAVPVTAIAAAADTSEAPYADPISPWDGDNAPPEVPEVQERLAGPSRRVRAVTAVAAWGGKGELTALGSKGPTYYFIVLFSFIVSLLYSLIQIK